MPFLQPGREATVVIPAGQSIRIGSPLGASASISIPQGLPGGPTQTVTDTNRTFGPYPAGATVSVESAAGVVEYVVAANPVLTDGPYNETAVSISGGTVQLVGGELRFGQVGGLASILLDGSGSPGNITQNAARGRAAFAAAGSSVVVTNSQVTANSTVLVSLRGGDSTLTSVRVTPAAGSFTVTGNAAATATTIFDYVVIKN